MAKKTAAKKTVTIPEPPEKTPEQGEKTPAYLKWLQKYHPEQYAEKFQNWRNK